MGAIFSEQFVRGQTAWEAALAMQRISPPPMSAKRPVVLERLNPLPLVPLEGRSEAPQPTPRSTTGDIYTDWDIDQLAQTLREMLEADR